MRLLCVTPLAWADALAISRALRRSPHPLRCVAFLGEARAAFAWRVLRASPRPESGAVAILVEDRPESARMHAAAFAKLGWRPHALGMRADDWLAEPSGARADAIVAYRMLHARDAAARRALLDQAPRRGAFFVACEPARDFPEGALTAAWPRWHSCVLREGGGWRSRLFEARSL